jgi:hypothetical protein
MPVLEFVEIFATAIHGDRSGDQPRLQVYGGQSPSICAITHAITVILFLVWLPFGKFYHILQRPAQLGIATYRKAGAEGPQTVCPHNSTAVHFADARG